MFYTLSLKDVSTEMLEGGFFVGWPNPPTFHY